MNKNFKIIQIHGLSGLLLLGLILTGVICGFVLFPIWVMMMGWNAIIADILRGPEINYLQAALLWAFTTLSLYMILKNSISIKIQKDDNLSDLDIKKIIKDAQENKIDNINALEKDKEEIKK